jgi:hypothetical protein
MKFYFLFLISILPCLLVTIFVLYPIITTKNQILKIGKHIVFVKKHSGLNEWHQMIYKHLKFPLDHQYGSHAIVLLAVLYASKTGPILELGMGSTSSPLLHRLALEQKRIIYSADTDLRWINYYSNFTVNNTLHQLKYVEIKSEMGIEWAKSGIANFADWTVVFIDHRPGPRRQFDLLLYADRSDIVVLHDTEHASLYKYDQGLSVYPYKYRFTKLRTYTDVLSLKNETVIKTIRYLLESTPDYYFSNITLK